MPSQTLENNPNTILDEELDDDITFHLARITHEEYEKAKVNKTPVKALCGLKRVPIPNPLAHKPCKVCFEMSMKGREIMS